MGSQRRCLWSESIHHNGVYNFEGVLAEDDICIVHDGVRPMLDPEVITDVVRVAKERGNAVTSMPTTSRFSLSSRGFRHHYAVHPPRDASSCVYTAGLPFWALDSKYHEAFEKGVGIDGSNYTNTMMVQLGVRLNSPSGRTATSSSPRRKTSSSSAHGRRRGMPAMNRLECPEYIADVDKSCSLPCHGEASNKTVVISRATELIGTFLVVLMRKNDIDGARCSVIALGRNIERKRARDCRTSVETTSRLRRAPLLR